MSTSTDASSSKEPLRRHLGIPANPDHVERKSERTSEAEIMFWLEQFPESEPGKKCTLDCGEQIAPGDYRIALNPGQKGFTLPWHYQNPEYYHVKCFEEITDFSEADFLDRITPVTPYHTKDDPLKNSSWYNLKMPRLKITRRLRDGIRIALVYRDIKNLLYEAGSSEYVQVAPRGMHSDIFSRLLIRLNRIESCNQNDPSSTREWNLFQMFLAVRDNDLKYLTDKHTPSIMLENWVAAKKAVKGG
ncbi:hypothetical protein BDZ45DRAFT_810937 [Acephala macrosclerotiorum]|nr:hypothetical protein BDZ45DRAFT_810937 [Acephala macrosclerotiorum]